MGFYVILLLSIGLVLLILMLCKWYKFTIIPKGMRLPAPKKFVMPKLKRNSNSKWEVESSSEEESSEEDDENLSSEEEEDIEWTF